MSPERKNASLVLATPVAVTFALALAILHACVESADDPSEPAVADAAPGGEDDEDGDEHEGADDAAPPPIEAGPAYAER